MTASKKAPTPEARARAADKRYRRLRAQTDAAKTERDAAILALLDAGVTPTQAGRLLDYSTSQIKLIRRDAAQDVGRET